MQLLSGYDVLGSLYDFATLESARISGAVTQQEPSIFEQLRSF